MAARIILDGGRFDGRHVCLQHLAETFQKREAVHLESGETIMVEHVYAIQRRGGVPVRYNGRVRYQHVPELIGVIR